MERKWYGIDWKWGQAQAHTHVHAQQDWMKKSNKCVGSIWVINFDAIEILFDIHTRSIALHSLAHLHACKSMTFCQITFDSVNFFSTCWLLNFFRVCDFIKLHCIVVVVFVFVFSLIFSISPIVRVMSWDLICKRCIQI